MNQGTRLLTRIHTVKRSATRKYIVRSFQIESEAHTTAYALDAFRSHKQKQQVRQGFPRSAATASLHELASLE